jgi:hypothetical protein
MWHKTQDPRRNKFHLGFKRKIELHPHFVIMYPIVYYQIMHAIIIIHKNSSVKIGLNTKLALLSSNLLLTSFMIPRFFQFIIQFITN